VFLSLPHNIKQSQNVKVPNTQVIVNPLEIWQNTYKYLTTKLANQSHMKVEIRNRLHFVIFSVSVQNLLSTRLVINNKKLKRTDL